MSHSSSFATNQNIAGWGYSVREINHHNFRVAIGSTSLFINRYIAFILVREQHLILRADLVRLIGSATTPSSAWFKT
jgi:hypothetical protein